MVVAVVVVVVETVEDDDARGIADWVVVLGSDARLPAVGCSLR